MITDCILIQDGAAHQIWPGTAKTALCWKVHAGEERPRAVFPAAIIDAIVEVEAGSARAGWRWDGAQFAAPAAAPVALPAYAAAKRWETETGGIAVNGVPVATDRGSQAMVAGAFAWLQQNPQASVKWKSAGGVFADLDAAAVAAIANAVGAHVQACFAKEAEVQAALAADPPAMTTTAEIDAAFAQVGA